jgi:ribosomal protein L31E
MLKDNEITFEFHQTNQNDYKVQIIVIDNFNNQEIFNKIGVIKIPKQLSVNLPSKNYLQGLYVKVFIDDNIIYESNLYKDESTIF